MTMRWIRKNGDVPYGSDRLPITSCGEDEPAEGDRENQVNTGAALAGVGPACQLPLGEGKFKKTDKKFSQGWWPSPEVRSSSSMHRAARSGV